MNFGGSGAIEFSALPNTPLPCSNISLGGFHFHTLSFLGSDPNTIFLSVSQLSSLTGICEKVLRERMAANAFRWHGVGKRKFIVLGEFLEDTRFR